MEGRIVDVRLDHRMQVEQPGTQLRQAGGELGKDSLQLAQAVFLVAAAHDDRSHEADRIKQRLDEAPPGIVGTVVQVFLVTHTFIGREDVIRPSPARTASRTRIWSAVRPSNSSGMLRMSGPSGDGNVHQLGSLQTTAPETTGGATMTAPGAHAPPGPAPGYVG